MEHTDGLKTIQDFSPNGAFSLYATCDASDAVISYIDLIRPLSIHRVARSILWLIITSRRARRAY